MPDKIIKVEITGAKELKKALEEFPKQTKTYMERAASQAASKIIFPTVGIKKYPDKTKANEPPVPYYIRGRGTQYSEGSGGNYLNSERYGTSWTRVRENYGVKMGNDASYAPYLTDEKLQARNMARIGWRKIVEVIHEKMPDIIATFDAFVVELLVKVGLK